MKTQLTKKWKNRAHSRSSDAMYGVVHLHCYCYPSSLLKNSWSGIATIGGFDQRTGPISKSAQAAKHDAHKLAIELLKDIRDGTKALMTLYDVGKDD